MAVQHNFDQVVKNYQRLKGRMTRILGTEAVAFAKDNFRKQGFEEFPGRVKKWKPRRKGAPRDKGRALLVDTGKLKRSVRVTRTTATQVHIGSDVAYARIHNEGGLVTGIAKVRQHIRRLRGGGATTVSAHTRKVNYRMPRRQYIGPSDELNRRFNQRISKELYKVFQQ